jgi:hypothetical protein
MPISFFVGLLLHSPGSAPEPPDFSRDVRPILAGKCLSCHGADEKHRMAVLRLDDRRSAVTML